MHRFGRAYLKSRSSDSFTAAMKDFIAPIEVNINNCGTIIIRKQTDPNGASGSFGYTSTGGLSPATFSLSDDGVQTYSSVQAGSYTVTENDPTPGLRPDQPHLHRKRWLQRDGERGTRTASITLAAGGTVDCTYINRQRGTIIIRKQTDPNGAAGTFGYTTSGGLSPSTFSLQDDGVRTCSNVAPGSYSVTENDPTPDST